MLSGWLCLQPRLCTSTCSPRRSSSAPGWSKEASWPASSSPSFSSSLPPSMPSRPASARTASTRPGSSCSPTASTRSTGWPWCHSTWRAPSRRSEQWFLPTPSPSLPLSSSPASCSQSFTPPSSSRRRTQRRRWWSTTVTCLPLHPTRSREAEAQQGVLATELLCLLFTSNPLSLPPLTRKTQSLGLDQLRHELDTPRGATGTTLGVGPKSFGLEAPVWAGAHRQLAPQHCFMRRRRRSTRLGTAWS